MQRVRFTTLALVLTGVLAAALPARAGSIWARRSRRAAFLFVDTKAREVGDLLTVVIRESTEITHSESRELEKSDETNFSATSLVFPYALTPHSDLLWNTKSKHDPNRQHPNLDYSSSRDFEGEANFDSEREFEDRLTVRVIDVLPNGNLVIEGRRERDVAGETRLMRISGLVRPEDVAPDNSVQSEFVGDFRVVYEGDGVETWFTMPGWFNRIVNWLWPF